MKTDSITNAISKNILYLIAGLIFLAQIAGVYYLFWPTINDAISYQSKIKSQQTELSDLKKSLNILSSVDPNKTDEDLEKVQAALPDEKKVGGVITGITKLGETSGVSVTVFGFSPGLISSSSATVLSDVPNFDNGLKAIPAEMSIVADWNTAANFIKKIQTSSQLLGVEQISFDTNSSTAKTNLSLGQVTLNIYFQPIDEKPIDWFKVEPLTNGEQTTIDGLAVEDIFTLPEEKQ